MNFGIDNIVTLYLPFSVILICLAKNRRLSLELFLISIISIGLSVLLKNIFKISGDSSGSNGISLSRYDFPSLSAQLAVTFWGYIFLKSRKLILLVIAILMIGLVSYFKIINHEHTLIDILGGIGVGTLLIIFFNLISNRLVKKNG